uniref:Uncharacterized protein n=1 Tax=Solanum lycopersicum TaxID=4081 RepID=A0A3Q7I1Q6_SOLLC
MGICEETECLLCGCKPEHLFFEYEYSMKCLMAVQRTNLEANMEETSKESHREDQQSTYPSNNSSPNISYLASTKWSIVEQSNSQTDGNYEEDQGGE